MSRGRYRILPSAILAGVIVGTLAAGAVLGFCYVASRIPAVSPASFRLASRPWWRVRNLVYSLVAFVLFGGLAFGYEALYLYALRPMKGQQS